MRLDKLFSGYESVRPAPLFVFTGNFMSPSVAMGMI